MMRIEDLPDELFEQQVQLCLQHLYDYSYLQDQPLVRWVFQAESSLDPVEAFRETITAIVEKLRPGAGISAHSRAARAYNLLTLRYLDQQDTPDVIIRMALSTRQFYREHSKAIHAVAQLLRARGGEIGIDKMASGPTVSIESEVARAHQRADQTHVNLNDLLDSVVSAVRGLAAERHLDAAVQPNPEPIEIQVDRGLLRQTLIWIVSQVLAFAEPDTQITLGAEHANGSARVVVTFHGTLPPDTNLLKASGDTLQLFVKTLEGELVFQSVRPDVTQAIFTLPIRESTILVVDDNPDLVDLFRRYLANRSYRLFSTQSGSEALQSARELHPDLIILDIMLPGQDGLEVLQKLKTQLSTRTIPVLVCSVLNAREIALSLGADDFIQKPPAQLDFLRIVSRWQDAAR